MHRGKHLGPQHRRSNKQYSVLRVQGTGFRLPDLGTRHMVDDVPDAAVVYHPYVILGASRGGGSASYARSHGRMELNHRYVGVLDGPTFWVQTGDLQMPRAPCSRKTTRTPHQKRKHSAASHSTAQYGTARYSTAQHGMAPHRRAGHGAALRSAPLLR